VNVRVQSRTVSGSELQIDGPEVAKLRDRHRVSRLRGTMRSCRDEQLSGDVDDMHMSARDDGAMTQALAL